MRIKRKVLTLLAVVMLMGAMLTACGDNESEETNQPAPSSAPIERERYHRPDPDPNRPLPERNPDGTLG